MDTQTLIRTLVLVLALINQVLCNMGMSPIPVSEAELEMLLSTIFTIVASIWAWWKNNDVTSAAKAGSAVTKSIKAGNLSAEEVNELVSASK